MDAGYASCRIQGAQRLSGAAGAAGVEAPGWVAAGGCTGFSLSLPPQALNSSAAMHAATRPGFRLASLMGIVGSL